jgi:hypothetical protein
MPPPPPPVWDAAPREFNEYQQQGFRDGMEGARRDFDNHRAPNVENRDEFRHPHVAPEFREAYRDGFRRGYDRAMDHLMGRPFRYSHSSLNTKRPGTYTAGPFTFPLDVQHPQHNNPCPNSSRSFTAR